MSWLFSKALVDSVSLPSSPEQGAGYSAATCSDGEPSAQWNVMPTPQGFWRNDKMMDASRLSRFGPTLRLLTADHGEAVLMSFLAAFPVRTLVSPETEKASTGSAAVCGPKWRASFAKYDRDSSLWRTHQHSLLGGLDEYSETWPRWGLMRDGECWERQTWAPITRGTGSGLWPTPTKSSADKEVVNSQGYRNIIAFAKMFPTPTATDYKGAPTLDAVKRRAEKSKRGVRLPEELAKNGEHGQLNPEWVEWLMGWPIGWTALKPLAMDKFHEWRQQHSPILGESE